MSMVGQSRSLKIFIRMPKHGDKRESKTDDPVIISSLAFNSETKLSSDSLCPSILILPYPTLSNGEFLKIFIFSERTEKKKFSSCISELENDFRSLFRFNYTPSVPKDCLFINNQESAPNIKPCSGTG